jgi:hypothetical protein
MQLTRAVMLIVSLLALPATGATIIQTESFGFNPNQTVNLDFSKFDTTLGTLDSVFITVNFTKTGGKYEVDNDSMSSGTVDLTHSVSGLLQSGDVSLRKAGVGVVYVGQSGSLQAINTLSNQSVGITTGDDIEAFNSTGLGDNVVYFPGNSNATDSGFIRTADITDYESVGAGTFSLDFTGTQNVNVTGLGGLQQSFTVSSIAGDVTVTYNYTEAIPEPEAALLGGLGFLALLKRRR